MTKSVKICLIAVIIIFIASAVISYFILKPTDNTMVEIVQNNKVIYTLDLSHEPDRTFRIEYSDDGWNEILLATWSQLQFRYLSSGDDIFQNT